MSIIEPKLLCAIQGVNAYQIENGEEHLLTKAGPQELSILLVPSSSNSVSDASSVKSSSRPPQKFYLLFEVLPALDLPVFPTTRIYRQAPRSYIISCSNPETESGSSIRIEFSEGINEKSFLKDKDTFENILTQQSVFVGSEADPNPIQASMAPYDPSTYQAREKYSPAHSISDGKLFLVDEKNGNIIGELGGGHKVIEDTQIKTSSTEPVEITLPTNSSNKIKVTPLSQSYLEMAKHPAYQNSSLVSTASTASQLIVNTSGFVCKTIQSQANSFVQKTKPNTKPMTFESTTHARVRKIRNLTEGAASLSAKTVGQVQRYAQNFGASVAKNDKVHVKGGIGPDGKPRENYKPGIFSKGIVAFSTIADGIDQAGRNILSGTSAAATTVVSHKYGPEAGEITKNLGTGVRNVGLIYIDATGVTRKAVIKSVAKGMVVGKMPGGADIVANGTGGYQLNNPTSFNPSPPKMNAGSVKPQTNEQYNSSFVAEKRANDNPPAYY
ncbi:hypothetical protein K3495_g2198 [Podosphaera aphanis]|nr:hypothetical protein K3495_g2198 [Podosphaera aphanis]